MGEWIRCSERMPRCEQGKWSKDVIALSDTGEVFRLACQGEYWQRTSAFVKSGSEKVVAWMPFPEPPEV